MRFVEKRMEKEGSTSIAFLSDYYFDLFFVRLSKKIKNPIPPSPFLFFFLSSSESLVPIFFAFFPSSPETPVSNFFPYWLLRKLVFLPSSFFLSVFIFLKTLNLHFFFFFSLQAFEVGEHQGFLLPAFHRKLVSSPFFLFYSFFTNPSYLFIY